MRLGVGLERGLEFGIGMGVRRRDEGRVRTGSGEVEAVRGARQDLGDEHLVLEARDLDELLEEDVRRDAPAARARHNQQRPALLAELPLAFDRSFCKAGDFTVESESEGGVRYVHQERVEGGGGEERGKVRDSQSSLDFELVVLDTEGGDDELVVLGVVDREMLRREVSRQRVLVDVPLPLELSGFLVDRAVVSYLCEEHVSRVLRVIRREHTLISFGGSQLAHLEEDEWMRSMYLRDELPMVDGV